MAGRLPGFSVLSSCMLNTDEIRSLQYFTGRAGTKSKGVLTHEHTLDVAIDDLDAFGEARVKHDLCRLREIEDGLNNTKALLLSEADSVVFNPKYRGILLAEGQRIVEALCFFLHVPLLRTPFRTRKRSGYL